MRSAESDISRARASADKGDVAAQLADKVRTLQSWKPTSRTTCGVKRLHLVLLDQSRVSRNRVRLALLPFDVLSARL